MTQDLIDMDRPVVFLADPEQSFGTSVTLFAYIRRELSLLSTLQIAYNGRQGLLGGALASSATTWIRACKKKMTSRLILA